MSAESLLVSVLTNDPVIGPLIDGRVYDTYMPELTPAKLYPCIVYTVVSRGHLRTLAGNAGTYSPRYQLDVWSLKSSDVRTIVRRLFTMEGVRGEADQDAKLRWLFVEDEHDSAEPTKQNDERAARSASVDVILWYNGTGG